MNVTREKIAKAYDKNESSLLHFPHKKKSPQPPNEVFRRFEIDQQPIDEETLEILGIAASSPSYNFLKEKY